MDVNKCCIAVLEFLNDDMPPTTKYGFNTPTNVNMSRGLKSNGFKNGMIEFTLYLNKAYYDGEPLWEESAREFFQGPRRTEFFTHVLYKTRRENLEKLLG